AGNSERALESEGHQGEEHDTEEPRIEDRLESIGLRIAQLAHIADRRFERVGRPCGDEQAAEEQGPAMGVPRCVGRGARPEGREVGVWKLPLRSGTTQTMNIGTITRRPVSFWVLAVESTPRCWIAKTISMMTAPMKNVALSETAGKKGRSKLRSDHDWMAGV